ncbi:chitin elicitor-binding protein-like [Phoenix dactylifera]|uniref:Chitin elicitor-binding protein-like n=1 Tax=Phoenix dactylifera TaxID=42345 RepID=A0A8B7BF97_PHODC|nr:chitin elicitor-binding protein-like [Phoenix dactylifera]
MGCLASIPCLSLLLLLLSQFFSAAFAGNFTCNATPSATCRGLAGYVVPNDTTYGHIRSLFQVDTLASLLGANNKSLSTPATQPVPANSTVLVPFPCRCANGTGKSDGVPVYTVKSTDTGLDDIARNTFDLFATYPEIADANNITNANVITPGEKLYIPLPCSCDPVRGEEVAHLAHVVAAGSTVEGIAAMFGTDEDTLLQLNGNFQPASLQAGQILDVPLRVCTSSIRSTSLDYDFMRLPAKSYALTAKGCVLCGCNNDTDQLDCKLNQSMSSACPAERCARDQKIGNSSTSGCEITACDYAGYANSSASGFEILAVNTTKNICNSSAPAGLGLKVSLWSGLLILLHMALMGPPFL